jgi:hypothetical protein
VDDFVVIKMDAEGGEWEILASMEQVGIHTLVDELFVRIYYKGPAGVEIDQNDRYAAHTQNDAVALLHHWRALGVYLLLPSLPFPRPPPFFFNCTYICALLAIITT